MSDAITGLVRIRLSNLPSLPRAVSGIAVEVDLGIDWPDAHDLDQLVRLAWRSDRLIVVGTNAASVVYTTQYLQERNAANEAIEVEFAAPDPF